MLPAERMMEKSVNNRNLTRIIFEISILMLQKQKNLSVLERQQIYLFLSTIHGSFDIFLSTSWLSNV